MASSTPHSSVVRLSPPRPADLSSIIQRIEDRRNAVNNSIAAGAPSVSFGHSPAPQTSFHSADKKSPRSRSPSSIRGAGNDTTSSQYATVGSSTEVALLRLDLQQRLAEIDLKKKTILKLEGDNLRLLHELDSVRTAEMEKRDALTKSHREETNRERQLCEDLQNKLIAEVAQRGLAERASAMAQEVKARAEALEGQLQEKEALVTELRRNLEAALSERNAATSRLREYEKADVANVLRGRLAVTEERLEATQGQLNDLQSALVSEERRRKQSDAALEEALRVAEARTADVAEKNTEAHELEATVARLRSEIERHLDKWEKHQLSQSQREETHTRDCLALQQQVDDGRAEVRKRIQQVYHLETHVAELQEQKRSLNEAHDAVSQSVRVLQGELSNVLERMKNAHHAVEEREAELSKMHVLSQEQKNQISALKAEVTTLQREVDTSCAAARAAREEVGEMSLLLAQKAAAEERLTIARKAHAGLENELIEEQRCTAHLRDRLAVLEQQLTTLQKEHAKVPELQRSLAVKEEEMDHLHGDLKVARLREEGLKEDLSAAREKCHMSETKYHVELERREEVERKLRTLEDAHQSSLGLYGKYAALQQYLSTATSEAGKALELNNALLEEVKSLELANRTLQQKFDHALEERSLLAAQVSEAQVYKLDMERALARAREAEGREHELLVMRRSDSQMKRVQELESLMVDAVRRATAAEAELHAMRQHVSSELQFGNVHEPSPTHISPERPPQVEMARPDAMRPTASNDDAEVSSASSGDEPSGNNGRDSNSRGQSTSLPTADPQNFSKDELVAYINRQEDKLSSQDRRMEMLSVQFAEALSELKQLKDDEAMRRSRSHSVVSSETNASPSGSPSWGTGSSVDLRRALHAAHDDIHRHHRISPSGGATPLVLAQRQQRSRAAPDARSLREPTRTPTPPRTALVRPDAAPSSRRSHPVSPEHPHVLRMSPPRRELPPNALGTPPRVPSPKTARIHHQRAVLADNVREKMSKLFQNARDVSLASPSPAKAPLSTSPRSFSPESQRRMTGVISPAR